MTGGGYTTRVPGPFTVVILFTTCGVWVLFVSRAINVFGQHLRHERDILWEAKLLLDSVCDLPRSTFPLTGELVRCDEAREAVRRGNAHLKAIESTSMMLLEELARAARRELVDVTWALGFIGVCAIIPIVIAWIMFRRFSQWSGERREEQLRMGMRLSPMARLRRPPRSLWLTNDPDEDTQPLAQSPTISRISGHDDSDSDDANSDELNDRYGTHGLDGETMSNIRADGHHKHD